MEKKPQKLILIDGNAIIHRAYHALPPLTTKSGELVNAVYGFSSTLLSVIEKFSPDFIIATFDLAGPTFRHEKFSQYKAHRVKADQELYDQIPKVKEVVRALNIPILEKEGYEADDVIGTLCRLTEDSKENMETVIVTGDLDALQLVNPKTKVYTMRRGLSDAVLYDEEKIKERYGLSPGQLIDFKGLRGDASDNIPGVKGIGEKTAVDLLKRFQTVEGVYANLGELKGAVKEKLERDRVMARKSKELATIFRSVPVDFDLESARTKDFDRQKAVQLFQKFNFFSLIKRLPGRNESLGGGEKTGENPEGIKDFKYESTDDKNRQKILEILESQKEIAVWLDWRGDGVFESEIASVAFSWKEGRAVVFSWDEKNRAGLEKILLSEKIEKIGYDLKSVALVLEKSGLQIAKIKFDTMLAAYSLFPGGKTDLPQLVLEAFGEEIGEKKEKGQLGLSFADKKEEDRKNCVRADYVFKLKKYYEKKMAEISAEQDREKKTLKNLEYVFEKVEMPLIPVLGAMEKNGARLNKTIFAGISENIGGRIVSLEKSIWKLAGEEFNVNSTKQLKEILFEKLKLPTENIKKGKTGFSTASSELKKLQKDHKIIEKIEEYRELFKLKTTYLDALPLLVRPDGRIHSSFNQAVTATGRLSSSDPNLQNIPIRTELGQVLRTAFEAEEGWKLVAADYSQIDLRAVAHVSKDKKMTELFWAGEDIHRATAAEINKVPLSQVTETMRRRAKELNFGVIYGMGAFGFSERTGVSREEAKKFIDSYFEKFQGVARYMENTRNFAKKSGYVETELGRRRYIPEINSPNFQVQSGAERMAVNMPIQGMSADIMKLAMIGVFEEYKKNPNVKMILQVHDEIILEVKEESAQEVGKKVKEIMEKAYELSVPLVVDVKIGDNWGEI